MKTPSRCGNCRKVAYKKEGQANEKAIEYSEEYEKDCRVYKCTACPSFLITTQPRNFKMSESSVQSKIRLDAAQNNSELWRNNVGVLKDITGRPVRFGLCNDSKQLNEEIKSSDLIGITPVTITQEMVGQTLGIFTAIETKEEDWKFYTSDKRAVAQNKFHDIVRKAGGFAGFARSVFEYNRIIGK